jgi:predicted permease
MESLFTDLRRAARSLTKSPGFTSVAVLTLALGIGASTAIFSVVRAVVTKPLAFPEPERLVALFETNLKKGHAKGRLSPANYLDFARAAQSRATFAAYNGYPLTLSGNGEARRVDVVAATPELFSVLGTAPAHGRAFSAEEAVRGGPKVAVLTDRLFAKAFGSDSSVVGRVVMLDGESYRVVGVLPPSFRFPVEGSDVVIPLVFPQDVEKYRGAHYLAGVGRLARGASAPEVSALVAGEARRLERAHPEKNLGWGAAVEPLRENVVGDVRRALLVLLGAVGLVALVASTNVANLLLARAAARQEMLAIESALGAGRGRLMRRLLAESGLLALAGAAAGLLLARWGIAAFLRFGPADIPRLGDVRIDGTVLGFTGALAAATCLVFGLLPALLATRGSLVESLKSRDRSGGARAGRFRAALVASEIALTLALLSGAGLLVKSFRTLLAVDPGVRTSSVLTFSVSVAEARYPNAEAIAGFYRDLLTRVRALPGVVAAGGINGLPLTHFGFWSTFTVDGAPVKEEDEPSGSLRIVTPGYFEALGIAPLSGRLFAPTDRRGSPGVVVASARARALFADRNPLGKRLKFGASPASDFVSGEVVGIVPDVKDAGLDADATPMFYGLEDQVASNEMTLVLKTTVPPLALVEAVRREVSALDPSVPVEDVSTLEDVVARSVAKPRFYALLLTVFASSSLLLAAVGLYGVLAYTVARRTREIGVRVALGAEPGDVLSLVLRDGTRLLGAGLFAGLLLAASTTWLLKKLLFGVSPLDPASLAAVAALLSAVAVLASVLPARRAARLDPLVALRSE